MHPVTKDVPSPSPPKERRQRRSHIRPKTIAGRRLSRVEIQEGIKLVDDMWYERPSSRTECVDGPRPCPFVSCKHHLYLDVKVETKSIKLNFPHLEVWEMEHTCALDVAEQGGLTLEEVGHILNLTRERVRQVEVAGLDKLRDSGVVDDMNRVFGLDHKFD
ncbi:MAG: DNA-binding protein [Proteobacteria bacterium]|nr:MAG: DNA-binding protein [Pseudomonadota bacterium]